ncbi:glycosyltransferase family 25 protein [Psychrobacter sp. DAB_AL62B]|uniref:glycosyltransferase family 25 protein n=1 Tax=Psychrobacter sp. DAB_AL62B TaxID=1028420 RepID=UPI0023816BD0|nr:glycosyltransferase family 25 protein [Psychrobacter sp. DAB_AL62B]MDE4453840.1 glycosyltransferase family 25 protein [Psychrobacter sp. DAB_AL62B]
MKTITYLINLDESYERLESAKSQLDNIDWQFERFPAFDGRGKKLSDFENYDDNQARKILGRSLLNSEIGCYLSHYNCALEFLKTDADFLVVLEDDMEISSDFKSVTEQLIAFLSHENELEWHLINIAAKKKKITKDITQINNHTLWHAYYFPVLGLGLIWSRKGAQEFIEKGRTITMPVDVFFQSWLSRNSKGLAIWPALVYPTGLDSDIWSEATAQNIERRDLENRDWSYSLKKKKRMMQNKRFAIKNLYSHK